MNPETDLLYFKTGLDELEPYLLSDELYWVISAPHISLPRLTLGNLLLTRLRLQARNALPPAEDARLEQLRQRWRSAWEKKAQREFRSRLSLWRNYLEDYFEAPSAYAADYSHEARSRVLMELLRSEMTAPLPEEELLRALDARLRTAFISGPFIWEAEIQAVFPAETWWYLYGRLKS